MLLLRRMRQRTMVFLALFLVVAVSSGVATGILGFLRAAEVDGVHSLLESRTGADRALELSLTTEADADAQDARVDALLGTVFRDGDRVLPVSVFRSTVSANPVPLSIVVRAFAASIPELESNADLIDGTWPAGAGHASVQADAAAALGLVPGDSLEVGNMTATITGTWRLSDPFDPRWVSDPLLTTGLEGAVLGPIVLSPDALVATGATTRTRSAIVPEVSALRAGDLQIFLTGWDGITDSLRSDGGFRVDSLDLGGRFDTAAESAQESVDALRAVVPVTLLVVAAIAILTLLQLGRLLASLRADEWLLLWSRGDTVPGLLRVTIIEALAVASLAAAAGTGLGLLALGEDPLLLRSLVWIVPATTVLVATLAFGATTFVALRSVARHEAAEDGGRAARVSGIAGPILLALAAGISTWQLLLYGSPLTPTRDGGTQVDPLAVLAPALVLLTLVTLALATVPMLTRPLDRLADRSTRLALVPRTLARRSRLLAAPLVLCALASGQVTLAAGYAQTWNATYTTASELRAGSELTVTGARARLTESTLDTIAGVDGVTVAAPVYSEQVLVGATTASMIAVTPAALAFLAIPVTGILDPAALADRITAPFDGPVLPDGTSTIGLTVDSTAATPDDLTVVVADEFGVQHSLPVTESYSAVLPAGRGEWRIDAIIVALKDGGAASLTITGITADGAAIDLGAGWSAAGFDPRPVFVAPVSSGPGFTDAAAVSTVHLTPPLGFLGGDTRPPVVVSTALAAEAGIRVGDIVPIYLDSRLDSVSCLVTAIVPAIPGARLESAFLIDGAIVQAARLGIYSELSPPRVAWLGADDPAVAADTVRAAITPGVTVSALSTDDNRAILGSAATALWIGAAGGGILSVVAVIAVVGAQVRSRRGEVDVLRALGVSDRELAATRRAELGAALAVGLIVGVLSGLVVTLLTIPALARAAVPESYAAIATTVGIHPLGLGIGLGAFALSFGIIGVEYGRRVTR